MQSTGVAEMDVPSELADLCGVPLQEMPGTAPMAVTRAVLRVIPGTVAVGRRTAFNSAI
jgi:hypothetical protein